MIELIVSWVMGIIFATLFASFLELLLPSSSMQKFVRVIMGLLIMLAILNPIIGFIERVPDSANITALAPRASRIAMEKDAEAAVRRRDDLIKAVYRQDVAKQMQALVMGVEGVAQARVDVALSDSQDGLVKIDRVTVFVRTGGNRSTVSTVAIGAPPAEPVLKPAMVGQIKQRLSELYQLPVHQITITSL